MIKRLKLMVSAGAVALCASFYPIHSEEYGRGHYTPGEGGSFAGILPQAGDSKFDLKFYSNDAHVDGGRQMPLGQYGGIHVDGYRSVTYFNFTHVTDAQFAGADVGFDLRLPLVYQETAAEIIRQGNISTTGQLIFSNNYGFGDIVITPLLLGWHNEASHVKTGVSVYAPTGEFDKTSLANTGMNYWTFTPFMAFTYVVPGKNELSFDTGFDFNTKNNDTDYQTGTQWHLDYVAAHYFNSWVSLGVAGTVYQQIEGDSGGAAVLGGSKAQSYGIGPILRYNGRSNDSDTSFEIKWIPEFDVKNRPEGNPLWFNFSWSF